MTKKTVTLTFSLLASIAITGCAPSEESKLAVRKHLFGHDALTCSESYSEMLKEGETEQYAQERYNGCVNNQ